MTTYIQQVSESDKAGQPTSAALISPSEPVSARNRNGSWPFGFPDENRPTRQRGAAAVQPAPLGICAIPDRKTSQVTVYSHGIEVESSFKYQVQKHDYSAKRGEICGFSAKARQRMLWTANKTDFTGYQGIYFATLTYHHNWTERDYRRDRENYLKRLRRLYPEAQFIWRLEPQRRGAPHFHILVILPCADTTVCEALEAHWHELVDKGNVHHKKHGAKVASLESGYTGVKIYLSKYSAKVDASGAAVQLKGRQWGKSRGWPTTPQQEAVLDSRSEVQLRRFLRGLMIARHNRSSLYAKTVVQGHTSKVWLDKDSEVAAVRRYIAVLQKGGFHPV